MPIFSLFDHLAKTSSAPTPKGRWTPPDEPEATAAQFVLGWTPKNDCVFVLPLTEATQSRGGIITPEQHRDRPQKGVVLAVGRGLWDAELQRLFPVDVAVGDLVTYGKYSGELFAIGDLHVFIMKNIELKARMPAGTFTLASHLMAAGTPTERWVYHEAHEFCDWCPKDTSPLVEEERERLREAHRAALADATGHP